MKRTCKVPGCQSPVRSSRATMCERHRARWRRHGDPMQETISQKELRPYVKRVERLIQRNTTGKIESGLHQIKTLLEMSSQEVISDFYERGRAMNKQWVKANQEILKVLKDSDPIRIGVTLAAMYLLQKEDPHRFASDRGFVFELVRKYRSLTDRNIGSYYNGETGRVTRVYKDLPSKVVEYMGTKIIEYYKTWTALVITKCETESKSLEKANKMLKEGFGL